MPKCITYNFQVKLAALDAWLREHGALKGKVEYGIFGDAGVGVYATDDVEEEETVCAVPARICLSFPVAYEWIKGFLWFEPESKVHKAILIYLLFVNERFHNPKSFWKPYFDALPDEYTLPLFWSEKTLTLLNGTPMRSATSRVQRVLRRNYDAIVGGLNRRYPKEFPTSVFTYERFLWAHSTLWTRCFNLPVHAGDTLSLAVVPLIDMFNHHPKSKHVVMLDDNDMVRFRSLQAYTRGAQLWNCYGKKNNSTLLFHYGFAIKDNPHKESVAFFVILTYRPFAPMMAAKEALLEKKNLLTRGRLCVAKGEDALTGLLAAARILTSTPMELYFYDELAPLSTALSPANELLAHRDIHAMIDSAMALLPSTQELEHLRATAPPMLVESAECYRNEMIGIVTDFRARLNALAPRPPPQAVELASPRNRATSAATQATDWLLAHAKLHPLITCVENKGGESGPRGFRLVATGTIEAGEVMLRIPAAETLSSIQAVGSPLGQQLKAAHFDDEDILLVWICQQRDERKSAWRSLWGLYEATLPAVPLWRDEKGLAILAGTPLHDELHRIRTKLTERHTALSTFLSGHRLFVPTLAAFEWAYALVLSLAHPMLVRGTPAVSMVPLLGAFEYEATSRALLSYDTAQECWILRASTEMKAGHGLCDSYGSADNLHLLLHHGFASASNKNDVISVHFDVQAPQEDELHGLRVAAMRVKDLTFTHFLRADSISQRLLGLMRIAVATQSELEAPPKNVRFASLMITPRNELAALTMLDEFLQGLVLPEPTSADARPMAAVYRASYDDILRCSRRLVAQQLGNLRE